MLEAILDRRNIEKAIIAVERNKGTGGIDKMQSDELRPFINSNYQTILKSIMKGVYESLPVRKVAIPKPQGGVRMLGIPSVVDRMLQQAVIKAQGYLNAGYTWVIEIDVEKFFDRVNHQKLMNLLSKRIRDKRTLQIINRYLKSGIMEGGVVSQRTEGTPQGSPLSPLLSNILLNELDKEWGLVHFLD